MRNWLTSYSDFRRPQSIGMLFSGRKRATPSGVGHAQQSTLTKLAAEKLAKEIGAEEKEGLPNFVESAYSEDTGTPAQRGGIVVV